MRFRFEPLLFILFLVACHTLRVGATGPTSRPARELISILASPAAHPAKWKAVQEIRERGKSASPELLMLLREKEHDARYYAIRALGYLKDPAAVDPLCEILLDRSYGPRRYAAIALGDIGEPRAVATLARALKDVSPVRQDAMDALVKIDSKEARAAVADYHFGSPASGLRLDISCNRTAFTVGDDIQIHAVLTSTATRPLLLGTDGREPFGYLVVQGSDGRFIETIDTGLRDGRSTEGHATYSLKPGESLNCVFAGRAVMWTRGEKDDHAFIGGGPAFLTLDFRQTAFHVRKSGDYVLRLVYKQDPESTASSAATSRATSRPTVVWQGKAVSNAIRLRIDGQVAVPHTQSHKSDSSNLEPDK